MSHSVIQHGIAVKAPWSFCSLTAFVGNLLIKLPHTGETEMTQTPNQLVENIEMIPVIM
jgi:hypothetical protein